MTAPPDDTSVRLLHLLRSFAAQSGPFRPVEAVAAAGPEAKADGVVLAQVLSKLHEECSVTSGPDGEQWLYRPEMRRKMQASAAPGPTGSGPTATPDTEIALAQAGQGEFAPEALEEMIATGTDPDRLAALAVALERAGQQAPARHLLVALRSALNTARDRRRTNDVLARGFFGRETELARLADWIARPKPGLPVRAFVIGGLPGIGKSFLLEKVVRVARDALNPILIRLDFDRPALGSGQDGTLFDEISRQVAFNLPHAAASLRELRLEAAKERVQVERNSTRRYLPRALLAGIVKEIRSSGRPVLVLLDTLEVLQSRGATFPDALMASFDRMVEAGMPGMTVIAAGRGQVFLEGSPRVAESVVLSGLDDDAARALLAAQGVDPGHWPRVLDLARGNPLLLILAARAIADGVLDQSGADGVAAEVAAGYLYRAILSRLPEDLREIAMASLVLRRIDAASLQAVIAPTLGRSLDAVAADQVLATLSAQMWLVYQDGEGLVHRSDVRGALLGLIHADRPALAVEIDVAAADYFAERDPLEALYHRLQASRGQDTLPEIPRDLASGFSGPMLDDLPPKARDAVLHARGQRSSNRYRENSRPDEPAGSAAPVFPLQPGTGGVEVPSKGLWLRHDAVTGTTIPLSTALDTTPPLPDPRALTDLANMLAVGAVEEAAHVMVQGLPHPFPADSEAGRLVLAHLWLSGRWAQARRVFLAQPADALDRALAESPQLLGRVLIEVWAEVRFVRLRARLADPGFRTLAAGALTQAGRIALRGGALDFAVIAAVGADPLPPGVEEGQDVLSGRMHGVPLARVAAVRASADTLRSGFGLSFVPGDGSDTPELPWEAGTRIAPLNPYDAPLRALVAQHDRQGGTVLTRRLAGLVPVLPEIAVLLAPEVEGTGSLAGRVSSFAPGIVDALGAMGLTAEWSGGLASVMRLADLSLIAQSAERWRRTVCGVWSYPGAPPVGWTGVEPPDWGSRHLVALFGAAPDPQATAVRALSIWSDPAGASPRPPGRRLRAVRTQVAGLTREAAVAGLLDRGFPVSVSVPLSFLAAEPAKDGDLSHTVRKGAP